MMKNYRLLIEDTIVGEEVEVWNTTDDQYNALDKQGYATFQENYLGIPHANTIPEENNTITQDAMFPAQQQLTVYSGKPNRETNSIKILCKDIQRQNRKVEHDINKEKKSAALKMPVIKIKTLKAININSSVQAKNAHNSHSFNEQKNVVTNIPVLKINSQKLNTIKNSTVNAERKIADISIGNKEVADSGSFLKSSNKISDKNLKSDDPRFFCSIRQDGNKSSYIIQDVQQQTIKCKLSSTKEPCINQQPIGCMSRPKVNEMCNKHLDLVEVKDEDLVKPGDIFASPAAFLDYTNARGQKWMFYFMIRNSRFKVGPKGHPYVAFGCCFSTNRNQKKNAMRKRRNYKTNCPSTVVIKQIKSLDHYKVTHVCYHHNHELSPAMLALLPPRYLLIDHYKEMKEEIADLASLDVDVSTIYNYMADKTGFKMKRQIIINHIQAMKKNNIQRQFSTDKLKSMLLKIKEISERYRPVEKNDKNKEEPTTSQTSSEEPVKIYKQLLDHRRTIEAREEAARVKLIENMNKPKRIRNRKKRKPPVTEENEEGIKKSRLETSPKTQENEEYYKGNRLKSNLKTEENEKCNKNMLECTATTKESEVCKKGRLESTLERISEDSEVLQSVRDLQRSMVDKINASPWSTRHLTSLDDPEEFSHYPIVYSTTDSHENRNEIDSNQYDEDSHAIDSGEIVSEETVVDTTFLENDINETHTNMGIVYEDTVTVVENEIELGNTTDNDYNIDNQEIDDQCGTKDQHSDTFQENYFNEIHDNIETVFEESVVEEEIELGNTTDNDYNIDNQETDGQCGTKDQHSNTCQENYLNETHANIEIVSEDSVVQEEIKLGNTTDHDYIDNHEIDGQSGTKDKHSDTNFQENDLDEPHANISVENNNTIADDINTKVQDSKADHEFKNQAGTDFIKLFEAAKLQMRSNSANFLDYVTDATSKEDGSKSKNLQQFTSRFLDYCEIALLQLNNKTFANDETHVDLTKQMIHMIKQMSLNDQMEKMRTDLKFMNGSLRLPSTDYKEVIINRHNIDLFIVQPNASTLVENLSKKISISVMDMLKNIYSEKAVLIKINRTDLSKQVTRTSLVYMLVKRPALVRPRGENHEYYKELCSDYLNTCVDLTGLVQTLSEENEQLKKKLFGEEDNNKLEYD